MSDYQEAPWPWCQVRTVGEMRAALARYSDDTAIVDMSGDAVAVVGLPGEPASDIDPAAPPYLDVGGYTELLDNGQFVEPADLWAAHMGAPDEQLGLGLDMLPMMQLQELLFGGRAEQIAAPGLTPAPWCVVGNVGELGLLGLVEDADPEELLP